MSRNAQKIAVVAIAILFVMLAICSFVFYRAKAAAVKGSVSRIKRGHFLTVDFDSNFDCEAQFQGIEISTDSWIVLRFQVNVISVGKIPAKDVPEIRVRSTWGLREWDIVSEGFDF